MQYTPGIFLLEGNTSCTASFEAAGTGPLHLLPSMLSWISMPDALSNGLQWPFTLRVDGPSGQQSGNNHRHSPRGKLSHARHEGRLIQRPVSAAAEYLARTLKALSLIQSLLLQTLVSANLSQSCLHRLNPNAQLPCVSCQRAPRRPPGISFSCSCPILLCWLEVFTFSGALVSACMKIAQMAASRLQNASS